MRLLRRRGTVRARSTGCPSASGASGRRAATTVAVREGPAVRVGGRELGPDGGRVAGLGAAGGRAATNRAVEVRRLSG